MMISPDGYASQLKDASYAELMEERDRLFADLKEFEAKEMAGDRSGREWMVRPGPDVRYQANMEYLAEICKLMNEKYIEEYVEGGRKLSDDFRSR